MVKVKSRERDDLAATPAANQVQQTAIPNQQDQLDGNHRKRQKASALSFSIESIMRGGNNNSSQSTTTSKQAYNTQSMNNTSNNNNNNTNQKLVIDAAAAGQLCVGVESPSSNCSSVRSNGNMSQNSSTCMSSPPLAESPSLNLNDEDNEDSRCDSAQSRLSSPISPGSHLTVVNQQESPHKQMSQQEELSKLSCDPIAASKAQKLSQNHQHQGASSKKSSTSSDSSRHSSGGGGGSTNPLLRDRKICDHPQLAPIECRLENLDLWHRFHPLDTEMIITKQGRRMFPPVKVNFGLSELAASSLCSRERYHVLMDVLPFDGKRYRYAYHKSSWQQAGKADPPSPPRLFLHPDGPFTLEQLRRQVISFEKIKLTNNDANKHGYIVLNSMHKYQPRIHLMLYRGKDSHANLANAPVSQLNEETCKTFIFSETIFTAVTAYQNHSITKLKIDSNPFAKGFRDSSRLTDFELESMQDLMSDGPCPFSPPRPPPHGFSQFLLAAAAQQNPHHFAAAAAAAASGSEDPTASLLRERTMMALDSIFQQQQQQHFHHQQNTPTSQQTSHQNNNNLNSNTTNNNNHLNSQQSHQQMQISHHPHPPPPQQQQNKPASPLSRSSASDQPSSMALNSIAQSRAATTTSSSNQSVNSSACPMPNSLVNTSCHPSSPGGAPYSFSHAQQQQQFMMSSHLDQLLQFHGNPLAAAMAAAAMASQSQPSSNPSHSQQTQQPAPTSFGLFGLPAQHQQQYNSQSPPYIPPLGPPPHQQHATSNRNSHSPCLTPTSPPSGNKNNSRNNNNRTQSPNSQQQQKNQQINSQAPNVDISLHYQPGAPPGLSHSQLQAAMFAAAQHQQHQMAALSMQLEREQQFAAALARHQQQQQQHSQKGAPVSAASASPAGNFYLSSHADDATANASQKLLHVNQLQQSVNSLLDQQQQANQNLATQQARHVHSAQNQFKQ